MRYRKAARIPERTTYRPLFESLQSGEPYEVIADSHDEAIPLRRNLISSMRRWIQPHKKLVTRIQGKSVFLQLVNK
jgi:hypothetical protein